MLVLSVRTFVKNRSRWDDSFGPKIIKIRASLAIFRPFQDFLLRNLEFKNQKPEFSKTKKLFKKQLSIESNRISNRSNRKSQKSSNGLKIARMARIFTIFGPNESSRRDLFLKKFQTNETNENSENWIFWNFVSAIFQHFEFWTYHVCVICVVNKMFER